MRQINCPVCKEPPYQPILSNEICACLKCGLSWTYIPDQLDTEALYKDEIYAIVDNRKSVFERIIFYEAGKVLKGAKNIQSKLNSLLDFGSGKGQFLWVAKEQGWHTLGIETAQDRAEFARKNYHVEVLGEMYTSGKIGDRRFDLISLNHVLEHLPDPITLLSQLVESNLSDQGLVYIEVPRANSWQAKIAGKNWMHWDIPKHLGHWNSKVLTAQLDQMNLKVVGKRSFSIHLGVLGMLQALMSVFGYRDNIILRLKRKKTLGLFLGIGLLLPFAFTLEGLSCFFQGSGIFGIYAEKND